MTVKLLRAYGGFDAGALYDASADVELELIATNNAIWAAQTSSAATGGGPGDAVGGGGGTGDITSIALIAPAVFTVSGSPVTTGAGTLTMSYSGTALPIANGGTGATSIGAAQTALQLLPGTDVQAYDTDLAAIAALSTTSFGRSLLTSADAAAIRVAAGTVIGTDVQGYDGDLQAIAVLSPSNDDVLQRKAGAWVNRTVAQLLSDLNLSASYQPLDSDLTSIAALATTSYGRSLLTTASVEALAASLSIPGGPSYLGTAANESAMVAFSGKVGDECLRTDLGTGGLRYELTALPASTAANWQPLQGTLASGTLVTIALLDGKLPRRLLVSVDASTQVTVTVGGVTQPVLIETQSGYWHEIAISDDPNAAQPTTMTVQRTSGSGVTSRFSLETL